MDQTFPERDQIHARSLILTLTAVSVVLPLISMIGWLSGSQILASYGGQFIPMAPSTAICFLILAVPLFMALRPIKDPAGHPGLGLVGALVAAYGFLVFLGSLTGLPVNPDDLLFKEMGAMAGHRIGRMSPVTGVLFLLSGLSLAARVRGLSAERPAKLGLLLAGLSGSAVLLAGMIFTLAYALGTPLLYESSIIPLAIPTAFSFLSLGGGLTISAVLSSTLSGHWYRRLDDIPIGTQLRLGMGVILIFVMFLGAMAWMNTDLMWLQTKTIYQHPFQVRRAVGKMAADVLTMRLGMKELMLAENDQGIAAARQKIETGKADASRQLAVLYDRYLGPRTDTNDLADAFAKWNVLREESIRLFHEGRKAEAIARGKHGGVSNTEAERVLSLLDKIDDFASDNGEQLYKVATEQKDSLGRKMTVLIAVIMLVSLIVSHGLRRGIKTPLELLTEASGQFRKGKMAARSGYTSANEFGVLSEAFNAMADTLETQLSINDKAARLSGIMLREIEARDFCRELLKSLIEQTGSQIGAIYLLNPRQTEFEHFASIGLAAGGRASFSAVAPEGEFGAALATGRMQLLSDIPAETRFTFTAVSGEFRPREIITLPLLAGGEAVAVISLASVLGYDKNAILLLEAILDVLAARVNGMLAYRQNQELTARLERQNQELSHQNTELAMQKRQLDEANRLKSAFLSNMSHELRTPLNSVIALAGVLSRRLTKTIPEEEYGYLEVIERNGRHLLSLINDILDLSRIESGREEISLSRFSIRKLAGEVVEMLMPQAREKGLSLVNQAGDDLPSVTSDSDKVRHILQNLVANAVKFTEAGSVEISARLSGDEIHVSVRDTGIGLTPDQLPRIFEEFRQADEGTSRKYGGTGLGLAIAKRYATLLRGRITVESTPGKGSTFTLGLPLTVFPAGSGADTIPPADDHPGTAGPSAIAGQGRCILLVEDNEPAVIQMTDILSGQGYRVEAVRGGKEALAHINASLPDAVILDLMMPEMDGFEVLTQLRETGKTLHLPVLVLTAKHVTREELSVLKENHIHQLIQKGDISKTELLAAVARMVAPPAKKSGPALRPRTRKPRQGKPVILVVEDNPDSMRAAKALLQEAYAVIEAENGKVGVEQARRHHPDCILMDLALPVMDGFASLAAIREDEALRHIPIIALTASAMKGDRENILAHGFDGYVSKPIDDNLLGKTLREVLDGSD